MKNEHSFRRLACLYLAAYCAEHVQQEHLTDAQVAHARVIFHTFLDAIDAPVILKPHPLHGVVPRHALCDTANLKLFVARFAYTYLSVGYRRKRG